MRRFQGRIHTYEQSDFPGATLNLTRDPVGCLAIAMRIMPPADKKGSCSDFPHAVGNHAARALGLFAPTRNKPIGETQEEHLLRSQPKLRARLFCFLLAQRSQTVGGIGFAIRMRTG